MKRCACQGALCTLCVLLTPVSLMADYYDCFHDGEYEEDANVWDVDDPWWSLYEPLGNPNDVTAQGGELWLWTTATYYPFALVAAHVDSGDPDPNTSTTYWGDNASHYLLSKVRYDPGYPDPNDRRGRACLMLNASPITWQGYAVSLDLDGPPSKMSWIGFYSVEGLNWQRLSPGLDLPKFDEPNGFWMVLQFESDGVQEDPNGKAVRAACWDGGKFDWSGAWLQEVDLGDPNSMANEPAGYWSEGRKALVAWSESGGGNGFPAQCRFDDVEARTGVFTNASSTLTLTVSNPENGVVTIDPDLLDDPNNLDPNDYNPPNVPGYDALRRYTRGTEVALVADPDPNGKGFNKWEVTDPIDANNNFTDTNLVLYLTMDRDWEVAAKFKCGSAALMPIIGLTFLILGVGVLARRIP